METRKDEVPHCMGVGNSTFFYSCPLTAAEESRLDCARRRNPQDASVSSSLDIVSKILFGGALAAGIAGALGTVGCAVYEKTTGNESESTVPLMVWGAYIVCAAFTAIGVLYDSRRNRSR